MSYCKIAPGHPVHEAYHATEYGFPQRDETVLFERSFLFTAARSSARS